MEAEDIGGGRRRRRRSEEDRVGEADDDVREAEDVREAATVRKGMVPTDGHRVAHPCRTSCEMNVAKWTPDGELKSRTGSD